LERLRKIAKYFGQDIRSPVLVSKLRPPGYETGATTRLRRSGGSTGTRWRKNGVGFCREFRVPEENPNK
jgi:hypothetical protein